MTELKEFSCLNDYLFKSIFRSKEARLAISRFLSELTGIDYEILVNADYQAGEIPKQNENEKGKISDCIVRITDNKKLIVEMNRSKSKYTSVKGTSYTFGVITESTRANNRYPEIILINIDNFNMYNTKKDILIFMLRDEEGHIENEPYKINKIIHKLLNFVHDFVKIVLGGKMLYFRNELDKNKYSTYQLNKAIQNKELFKVDKGLYSDVEFVNPLEIILKKYPNAIFTSDSAYYYYNLTDVIPDYFYLATKRTDSRINNKNIKQVFIPNDLFEFGKTQIEVENVKINIYDEERMLVELIRKKNIIPFDYYKEIIINYRKRTNQLDIYKIGKYISRYKNESSLYETLMREVF